MNSNQLIDAYKKHHGIESDYALAPRLHITRATIHTWRRRGMPERLAFQFAIELRLDPAEILAAVRADHATDAAIKKTWEKVARTMASRAAVLALAIFSAVFFVAPQDAAAADSQLSGIYITRTWRRLARVFAYFLSKTRSSAAHFLHHPQQLSLL